MKRIAVNVNETEYDEISRWSAAEGCSRSSYLVRLHRDYLHRANKEGMRTPKDKSAEEKYEFSPNSGV